MNPSEVRLINTSLLLLVLTGGAGVFMLIYPQYAPAFRVAHLHLGIVGFFLQFVMGVAFWLMPRPGGMNRQTRLATVVLITLNTGVIIRTIFDPMWRFTGISAYQTWLVIGGSLQLAAMIMFAWAMKQRVVTAAEIVRRRSIARQSKSSKEFPESK